MGNGETGDVFVDPDDPNIVFNISNGSPMGGGAAFTRNNLKTGQNEVRNIWPEPIFGLNASEMPYRFQWDTPFLISKYDHDTIYSAGNVVFKSTDEGLSWEPISGDLTRDLKDKQVITGTPWLPEYFGQEIYSTINRLVESPLQKGLLWAGSDDGLIHLTRDGGETWKNVSIPNLPDYAFIRELEASPHDAATLYVAISRYNTADDYAPYLFKTSDFGETWTDLSSEFPKGQTTYTIREDPIRKGLLYVGTETDVFRVPGRRPTLAEHSLEHATCSGGGPDGQGCRPGRCDQWPWVLDPGRRDSAARYRTPSWPESLPPVRRTGPYPLRLQLVDELRSRWRPGRLEEVLRAEPCGPAIPITSWGSSTARRNANSSMPATPSHWGR